MFGEFLYVVFLEPSKLHSAYFQNVNPNIFQTIFRNNPPIPPQLFYSPDNSNFFWFPLKVWVIGNQLYFPVRAKAKMTMGKGKDDDDDQFWQRQDCWNYLQHNFLLVVPWLRREALSTVGKRSCFTRISILMHTTSIRKHQAPTEGLSVLHLFRRNNINLVATLLHEGVSKKPFLCSLIT